MPWLTCPCPSTATASRCRDYQYVLDHALAWTWFFTKGNLGEVYNVGTGREMTNLEMVEILLDCTG